MCIRDRYGAVGMAIVFFILVFLKLFLKGQRIDDILAMYAAFLFAHYVYKYRMDKVHKNIYPMPVSYTHLDCAAGKNSHVHTNAKHCQNDHPSAVLQHVWAQR